jgi:selenocysteine lyase/cysteine desulfurase
MDRRQFLGSSAKAFGGVAATGPRRKEERLRYLTRYCVDRLSKLPSVRFLTAFDPGMSC